MKLDLEKVEEYLESKGACPQSYPGISEQGYEDKLLLTADWNDVSQKFYGWVESNFNIELGWCDEWMSCSECGKAVREKADSYGWQPSWAWTSDCSIACVECYENCITDIIDCYVNDTHALPADIYPLIEKEGFVCYSPDEYCQVFETGWHPGQDADPQEIAKDIEEQLPDHEYIFKLDSVGQFDVSWSVFIRKVE